nr:shematrin-like protein 2 isoform X4 [Bactrocera oleae]XP_036232298.1 shematrin-like protein 2 isoform X4 [Bactrocera oleae]
MWKILLVCIVAVFVMNADGARNNKRYAGGYAGSSAGSYAGAGGSAGGYGGGYDDYDYGYAPDFGFIDPYLFHQQLTAQILANQATQHQRIQQQIAQQQAYFQNAYPPTYYGGGNRYGTTNRYAPNHAIAAASIGPGGSYHTANISPANPDVPNITNRFGGPSSPGGYKGVSVSSFSSSSDINGQKSSQRGAQTTINDNGKITTYRVQS